MKIEIGSPVDCTDGEAGHVADAVIDPREKKLTHLVIVPQRKHLIARLVPIADVEPDPNGERLRLACSVEQLRRYPFVEERAYVSLTDPITTDEGWDVGIERVMTLPYYSVQYDAVDVSEAAVIAYDRVPKDEVEIRRSSSVTSSDDHDLGTVDGFVVDEDHITHVVLQHGHLWGKREVAIPINLVRRVNNDEVVLRATRDEVAALPEVAFKRHH